MEKALPKKVLNNIQLLDDITDQWIHWDREDAVILAGSRFYKAVTHQEAMIAIESDYWSRREIDLGSDMDFRDATYITDRLFRLGKMHGFDLFTDYGTGTKYLLSHYLKAFEDAHSADLIQKYADKHHYKLGTFCSVNELSDECRLIQVIDDKEDKENDSKGSKEG